jgi:hypothetical protein
MNWKVLKLELRGGHGTTSRKVAVSTPGGLIAIFHSLNPSGRTGVDSASNRNEYEGCFLGGKPAGAWVSQPCLIHLLIIWKFWEPQTPGALRASPCRCNDCFTFF